MKINSTDQFYNTEAQRPVSVSSNKIKLQKKKKTISNSGYVHDEKTKRTYKVGKRIDCVVSIGQCNWDGKRAHTFPACSLHLPPHTPPSKWNKSLVSLHHSYDPSNPRTLPRAGKEFLGTPSPWPCLWSHKRTKTCLQVPSLVSSMGSKCMCRTQWSLPTNETDTPQSNSSRN